MLRRLVRWIVRAALAVTVLIIAARVVDYFGRRIPAGSVLLVKLDGPVVERGGGPLSDLVGTNETPLNLVRRAIDKAKDDPRIVGLALKVIDPQLEFAQAQELCSLISGLARRGKWSAAYLESAGEGAPGNLPYLVASCADEVSLMPQGELNLIGVRLQEMFARGMLERLKIEPEFDAIGRYKSAANVFTQTDFTAAQREEDDAVVGSLFGQLVGKVAERRRLAPDSVKAIIDRAPLLAADGLKLKLVDRVEYEDQFDKRIKHYRQSEHYLADYRDYARAGVRLLPDHRDRIAVVYASGVIERGRGGIDPLFSADTPAMGSDRIVEAFREVRRDDSVRAVVFRIDSPGGSVIASELIRRAVELTARKKPVVASLSGYGASGGYWVAAPARRIFAEAGTLTGSIGVLGGKFNLARTAGAVGVNTGAATRGANVMMYDPFSAFTPAQQQLFHDQILGDTYRHFIALVARHTHLSPAEVDQVAQGRVWTGSEALKRRLIDGLGGLNAAIEEARKLAKVPAGRPVRIVEMPERPGIVEQLLAGGLVQATAGASAAAEARLRPLLAILRTARLAAGGEDGLVYCPVRPAM